MQPRVQRRLLRARTSLLCETRLLCAGSGLLRQACWLREGLRLRCWLRLRQQGALCRVALRRLHHKVQDLHPVPESACSRSPGCHAGRRSGSCPEARRWPVAGRPGCEVNRQRQVRLKPNTAYELDLTKGLPGSNLGRAFFCTEPAYVASRTIRQQRWIRRLRKSAGTVWRLISRIARP